ncbi:acetyltransferase [Microbacterium sp. CFH 31415]|uniref:acyltransferase family protein n=1 Tax=Microbacterium sp. CFH 31415 TaxID=2921732 RepID=UPI001F134A46|nr:acyltransferase family protein [Microbacterium sp. CFH 31415]MCH6231764.1 acetyltransferase [Microbacterium sp. CFH 31415]
MTSLALAPPSSRYAGLDGLRAVAVALVLVYHLFPPALLPGGFVGVDVFFVISGFLITSLLLREHESTGRIRLGAFWVRRARRLLPAMALVVTVCSSIAWLIGGDVLLRLGEQVLGAATFSYNWVSISGDVGYFGSGAPELFRNFWSLAVEEQFYVLWPLVLPLFLLLPRGAVRAACAVGLAAASAAWMAGLVSAGGDVTRAYFGTDTHSFGILLGVALAFLLDGLLRPRHEVAAAPLPAVTPPPGWTIVLPSSLRTAPATRASWIESKAARTVTGWLGIVSLAGIAVCASLPAGDDAATFPGALLAASVFTALAIVAGVWPGSWFGPALDVRPLKWVGDRSYGIYLWHWPLLVLATAALPASGTTAPMWIGLGVLAVTLVAAEASFRFVETPVRRLGFLASLRRLRDLVRAGSRGRLRAIGVVAAGVLVLGGTSAAIAAAPTESSGESAVAAGQAALDEANRRPTSTATPTPTATAASETPAPVVADPSPTGKPLTTKPSPVPQPTPVVGGEISAVGDSVMLASVPALFERLPGIQVDAEVSRSTWAGPGILEGLAARGELRRYVVVALGTNGPVDQDALARMAEIAGSDRHLILVNAYAPRDWIPGVNADLAAFAKSHPGVVVADWSAAISSRTDLLAGDSIHPDAGGATVFAEMVARSVDAVERERAQDQYERELRLYERLTHRPLPIAQ